jgi:DNA relaxase NicK
MLTVTMDWIAFTIKEMTKNGQAWLDAYCSDKTCVPAAPKHGYTSAAASEEGILHYWNDNRPEMGHHVVISGSALHRVSARRCVAQKALLEQIVNTAGRVSRLDLAKDASDVPLSITTLWAVFCTRGLGGRSHKVTHMESENGGETIYIGSRSSERFIRIYNKAAEQYLHNRHWTRFEVETKGMVARMVASVLVNTDDWGSVFDGLCRRMADFSGTEFATVFFDWNTSEIGLPKIEKQSDTEKWIETQVTPAVARFYVEHKNSPAIARLLDMLIFLKNTHERGS